MTDSTSADTFARSALAVLQLDSRAVPQDEGLAVWANELPLSGVISLRGDARDPAFAAAARLSLEIDLPVIACSYASQAVLDLLWLAPDEWLLLCPRAQVDQWIANLTTVLAGVHHQVIDNSGGFTQIELCGTQARKVLSHCSGYDFSRLVPGRVVGTTFGSAAAYIRRGRRMSAEHFVLLVRRSFADYVWKYLARAASPYGFGVHSIDN